MAAIIMATTERLMPARVALEDKVSFAAILSSRPEDGDTDAVPDGDREGTVDDTGDGPIDGSLDGLLDPVSVGPLDGSMDGPVDGRTEGRTLGLSVDPDGAILCDGVALGSIVGELLGMLVGAVGKLVGAMVGTGATSLEQTFASKEEQTGARLSNCAAVS
jgi:hypothetical protein